MRLFNKDFSDNNREKTASEAKVTKAKKEKKENELPYRKLLLAMLIISAVTLAAAIGICTFEVIDHFTVASVVKTMAQEQGLALERADKQGNLGNYNVASTNNTIQSTPEGQYVITCELQFTNFGKTGMSFNDAITCIAYQNDKEVKPRVSIEDAGTDDEADYKVRNGRSTKVILTYVVPKNDANVLVDMKAGGYTFTYTLKLSDPTGQLTGEIPAEQTVPEVTGDSNVSPTEQTVSEVTEAPTP